VSASCRCESCREGSTYYCLKQAAGLFSYSSGPNGLSREEQMLVGLLPKASPRDPRELAAARLLAAAEALDADYQAKLRGVRYLVDLAGEQYELEV
jgi:hypothetical protein